MRRAFTLVEAMVIIAVIGIITAISLPRFDVPLTTKLRLENEARRIQSDLRLARRLAVTDGVDHILEIYPASHQYKIYQGSIDPANQVGETRTLAASITLSGDTVFTFEPQGNADAASGTNISLNEGSYQWDITVTIATGRIGMVSH